MNYTLVTSAYNDSAEYIGDEKQAKSLQKMGIEPELISPDHNVCSIGFCDKEQKWYGWSHRAIYGFGIGSKIKKGDCAYQARNKEDFLEQQKNFWGGNEWHKDEKVSEESEEGVIGALYTDTYTNEVPNESLRGTEYRNFTPYPKSYGRGEWKAETLEDAKQMAVDFANGVR